jgi:hypothetical protein
MLFLWFEVVEAKNKIIKFQNSNTCITYIEDIINSSLVTPTSSTELLPQF